MTDYGNFSKPLAASRLYRLVDIRRGSERSDHAAFTWEQPHNVSSVLVFGQASGQLAVDAKTYALNKYQLFIIPGGARVRIAPGDNVCPEWYDVRFQALQEQGTDGRPDPASVYAPLPFSASRELRVRYSKALAQRLADVAREWNSGQMWRKWKAAARFQLLLADWLEKDEHARSRRDGDTLRQTAAYMREHMEEEMTREQLAAMAGLSPDYYSRAFKKMYGKSPMAYLTELRMGEAKRRMLASGQSVRTIAFSLGFQDEFYFSRKFKEETGLAPSVYVNRIKETGKIASLNHLVTGHLMALNMEPYAAVKNDAFPAVSGLRHTFGIGRAYPDLERLTAARPDLIVASGKREQEGSEEEQRIDQIAPTVTLHYADDWRTHLQTVARLIGKEKEADRWLDRYQDTAAHLGRRVRGKLGGERVAVVGFGADSRMYLFGKRNIGTVLYEDLQLAIPEGVMDIAHYREITLQELLGLEAERVMFTSFQHDGSATADRSMQRSARSLMEHEQWRARREERKIKVHSLLDTRHLYTSYNAMSHQLLLHKICDLLNIEH